SDIGALCNDAGHGILNAHALRVKETLLRINKETTGHRLLRGGVVPGGAALRTVPTPGRLAEIGADIREIVTLALGNSLAAARFQQRAAEIDASLVLLDTLVRTVGPGAIGGLPEAGGPSSTGVGIVEGWRGTIVHRVELDADQYLSRLKVVDPSFLNWPALPV